MTTQTVPLGRPILFSEPLAALICKRVSAGESLRAVCADPGMPNFATVMRWVDKNAEFCDQYSTAQRVRTEAAIDSLTELIEQEPARLEDGRVDPGWVALQRLRIDTRRWIASKLLPKKYGDHHTLAVDAKSEQKQYVVMIPARTTNDPMEWARRVHAERVASGELPPDSPLPGSRP